MDNIITWLIIMGIIYILPEVFRQDKKRKGGRGKYKYPQFPEFPKFPEEKPNMPPVEIKIEYPKATLPEKAAPKKAATPKPAAPVLPKPAVASPPPAQLPTVTASASPWEGSLTPQMLANAVIFSEVFLPPRAYRPFGKNYGGKNRY